MGNLNSFIPIILLVPTMPVIPEKPENNYFKYYNVVLQ